MHQKSNVLELASYINMENVPDSWQKAMEKIENQIPKQIEWLNIKTAQEVLDFYEIKEENFRKQYLETIEMIYQDEILKTIVYLWHYILYKDETLSHDVWSWKTNTNLYQSHGNYMLPVVAMLSGYSIHKKVIKQRNFSEKQITYQRENIRKTCLNDSKKYHISGIRFSQMIWGSYFMKGRIIQVGRLQYELKATNFKNLEQYGKKDRDYVYIHIPEGENLLEDEVAQSLKDAKIYIEKYFPEINVSKLSFYTQTWLLSEELDDILPNSSNIMKFKKRFHVVEQVENKEDFLNFVFQANMCEPIDYQQLKENTSLQKKLKELLIKGQDLHIGLGIIE